MFALGLLLLEIISDIVCKIIYKLISFQKRIKNDIDNNNSKNGTEIWIYTKSLESFCSSRSSFESKMNCNKKSANASFLVLKALIPVFKHWILVVKFGGTTLWMEAYDSDGVLVADILESEPEGVEERSLIGNVSLSINQMFKLFNNNKLVGEKYSLTGANCQSWIKGILKELGLKENLTIINEVMVLLGFAAANFGLASVSSSTPGVPVVMASTVASGLTSGSESIGSSKKSRFSESSKS
ncbi:UNVERIFIED_CONTAM: hypothetical protein RMT77_013206 [Armadillidium vulgare]